jgi:hypothetical protein
MAEPSSWAKQLFWSKIASKGLMPNMRQSATKFIVVFSLCAATALGQNVSPASVNQSAPAQNSAPVATEDANSKKAKDLINKMIQALGGQAYLNMQDMESAGRTYGFDHGEPEGAGAPYWSFWKWREKERFEFTKQRDWIVIYNGDKGYEITYKGTAAVEKDQLEDYLRRRHYSIQEILRGWMAQPGTVCFYEGAAAAERKPAEQVTIMNAQNEGVTLYIDQNTFLPIKRTFVWRDPQTRDRTEESEIYDNYRSVQGIMTPMSITRQKNGLATNQRFITEVKYNQNIPDSMFAATITAPAKGQDKGK